MKIIAVLLVAAATSCYGQGASRTLPELTPEETKCYSALLRDNEAAIQSACSQTTITDVSCSESQRECDSLNAGFYCECNRADIGNGLLSVCGGSNAQCSGSVSGSVGLSAFPVMISLMLMSTLVLLVF